MILLSVVICISISSCTATKKIIPPDYNKKVEDKPPDATIKPTSTPISTPTPTPTPTPTATPTPSTKPVLSQKLPISTEYAVLVDIDDQRVYVYDKQQIIRTMVCSTGIEKPETETHIGKFKIQERAKWFFSKTYKQGGKFWVGYDGDFLFHSVPAYEDKTTIPEEAAKLGTPASHGCIRLSEIDAEWFYNKIPKGSNVIIQK